METTPSTKPTGERQKMPKSRSKKELQQLILMRQLLADLANHKYKNVVVMAGAGISTAAGIPDFRSPKTGLYANLQKFNLPYPEAVFDIQYLRKNPSPFFLLCSEMYPTQFKPTAFHHFIKWISDLGCLKRVYTQNIDTLERLAGVPPSKIVEAHGSFARNFCIDCKVEAPKHKVEKFILEKRGVYRCEECNGIVKPEIVFFGEALPSRFFECMETDFNEDIDLVIVAGTSLQVGPFNQLPDMVLKSVKRYLINLERVGSLGKRDNDVLVLGKLENLDPLLTDVRKGSANVQDKDAVASDKVDSGANIEASTEVDSSAGVGSSSKASKDASGDASELPDKDGSVKDAEDTDAISAKDAESTGAKDSAKDAKSNAKDTEDTAETVLSLLDQVNIK